MGYDFRMEYDDATVHPVHGAGEANLSIDGRLIDASLGAPGSAGAAAEGRMLQCEGRRERVFVAHAGDVAYIHLRGRVFRVEASNALERARLAAIPSGGEEVLRAPMPGTVVEISVEPGQSVETGQLLLTIESMKLQTAITASHAARVAEVCVAAGATFDQGDSLVRLEAEEETAR